MSGRALTHRGTRRDADGDGILPDPGFSSRRWVSSSSRSSSGGRSRWSVDDWSQPLEAVVFALVFAVVYFGSLSLLGDSESSGESG
jgi:hypothetical protein